MKRMEGVLLLGVERGRRMKKRKKEKEEEEEKKEVERTPVVASRKASGAWRKKGGVR